MTTLTLLTREARACPWHESRLGCVPQPLPPILALALALALALTPIGDDKPDAILGASIVSVSEEWVKFGKGRNDKFRNPRTAGGFVINSTELRSVNFMMEPLDKPPVQPRTTGRRAAVVSAPRPKVYQMPKEIEDEIRLRCW